MSCCVVPIVGRHANFPLTHLALGPDMLAITRLGDDLPFCPVYVGVCCILAALYPAAFWAPRRGIAHQLAQNPHLQNVVICRMQGAGRRQPIDNGGKNQPRFGDSRLIANDAKAVPSRLAHLINQRFAAGGIQPVCCG